MACRDTQSCGKGGTHVEERRGALRTWSWCDSVTYYIYAAPPPSTLIAICSSVNHQMPTGK